MQVLTRYGGTPRAPARQPWSLTAGAAAQRLKATTGPGTQGPNGSSASSASSAPAAAFAAGDGNSHNNGGDGGGRRVQPVTYGDGDKSDGGGWAAVTRASRQVWGILLLVIPAIQPLVWPLVAWQCARGFGAEASKELGCFETFGVEASKVLGARLESAVMLMKKEDGVQRIGSDGMRAIGKGISLAGLAIGLGGLAIGWGIRRSGRPNGGGNPA